MERETQVLTMDDYVGQFLVGVQVFNVVLGGFGLVALLLASLGTYGVLAYSVTQRRKEIGIRMAIGAARGSVIQMVARQGLAMSAAGLLVGGLAMFPLLRVLENLLANFADIRHGTVWMVAAILFVVTAVASFVPALRAASSSPVRALRVE